MSRCAVRWLAISAALAAVTGPALAIEDFGGVCLEYVNSGTTYSIRNSYLMTGSEIQSELGGSLFKYQSYQTYLVVLWQDGGFTALSGTLGMGFPRYLIMETDVIDQDGRDYRVTKSYSGVCL